MADAEAEEEPVRMSTRHPPNVGCQVRGRLRPEADDPGRHDEPVACPEQLGDQAEVGTGRAEPERRDAKLLELAGNSGSLPAFFVGEEPPEHPDPDPSELEGHPISFRPSRGWRALKLVGKHSHVVGTANRGATVSLYPMTGCGRAPGRPRWS